MDVCDETRKKKKKMRLWDSPFPYSMNIFLFNQLCAKVLMADIQKTFATFAGRILYPLTIPNRQFWQTTTTKKESHIPVVDAGKSWKLFSYYIVWEEKKPGCIRLRETLDPWTRSEAVYFVKQHSHLPPTVKLKVKIYKSQENFSNNWRHFSAAGCAGI